MTRSTQDLKQHFWNRLSESPFMMVGTTDPVAHSEPLTAQLDKDQVDTIFFFIRKDNRLARGGPVMAQFVSKGHDYFACLSGTASLHNDPAMIEKLWSKPAEAWFPGGKSDPDLALLRFHVDDAELWESDISVMGRIKLLFGGAIKAEDEGSHARVQSTAV